MANTITFDVALPALADGHDVVSRELTSVIDGGTPDVRSATATDTVVTGFSAPQGSTVDLSLVDIDDGGNRSTASTLQFVATDTVPPAQPGELSITNLSEV